MKKRIKKSIFLIKIIYLTTLVLFMLISCNSENTKQNLAENQSKDTIKTTKAVEKQVITPIVKYKKKQIDSIAQQVYGDFDTTLFYCQIENKVLFYVAKGELENSVYSIDWKKKHLKLGLVNQNSKQIIPCEYDIIYNPGDLYKNLIVVEKNNTYNLFNIDGHKYFDEEVDALYPEYEYKDVICQFIKNGNYGYLATDGTIYTAIDLVTHKDLAQSPILNEKIKEWDSNKSKITDLFYMKDCCEDNSVFFSSPWFQEFMFNKTDVLLSNHIQLATEYFKLNNGFSHVIIANHTKEDDASDIMDFIQRYFTVIDEKGNRIQQIYLPDEYYYKPDESNFHYRFIGDTLLEIQHEKQGDVTWDYFKVASDGQVLPIKTQRQYSFTKYVVMTEEFPFKKYIVEEEYNDPDQIAAYAPYIVKSGFSLEEYQYMRNEIFATYGYKFKTEKWQKEFSKYNWYKPVKDNVDDSLSPIEKKNVEFILKMEKELNKK